jgi:protein transport protein SEC20
VGSAVMHGVSSPEESGQVKMQRDVKENPVEGLPNEDLPTIKVGEDHTAGSHEAIQEDINKIVDAVNEAEDLGNIPKGKVDGARNTKKRMWEETEGMVDTDRPRDEL